MSEINFCYIDNDSSLSEMVDKCLKQSAIVLDTEFIRTDTFYPRPALIQVYDGNQVYLVDPLAITNFEPLKTLFRAQSTVKVMHSTSEDMEVFSCLLDCIPTPLVDTQIAASLAGMEYSLSYQKLVAAVIGQSLDKAETRSDWLQRPLSDRQLHYAVDDVLWLLEVYKRLMQQLTELGRVDWLQEECENLVLRAENPAPYSEYYLRVKAAWRLDAPSLNVLRSLCIWREQVAREKNVPRNRIASDAALLEMAKFRPVDKEGLSQISQLRHGNIRSGGDSMLEVIVSANAMSSDQFPVTLAALNSPETRAKMKLMKKLVTEIAEKTGLAKEMMGRKRDLEEFMFAEDRSKTLIGSGWRKGILAEKIMAVLQVE